MASWVRKPNTKLSAAASGAGDVGDDGVEGDGGVDVDADVAVAVPAAETAMVRMGPELGRTTLPCVHMLLHVSPRSAGLFGNSGLGRERGEGGRGLSCVGLIEPYCEV